MDSVIRKRALVVAGTCLALLLGATVAVGITRTGGPAPTDEDVPVIVTHRDVQTPPVSPAGAADSSTTSLPAETPQPIDTPAQQTQPAQTTPPRPDPSDDDSADADDAEDDEDADDHEVVVPPVHEEEPDDERPAEDSHDEDSDPGESSEQHER